MKREKTALAHVVIILSVLFSFTAGSAFAQDFVSVVAGESATREFYLHDVFDYGNLSYGHYFVVSCVGIDEPAGDLRITVSGAPTKEFTGRVVYSLMGAGVSVDEGFASIFAGGAIPGSDLSSTVSINSIFGIYCLVVKIEKIVGEVEKPVPFTIKFAVSKRQEAEE